MAIIPRGMGASMQRASYEPTVMARKQQYASVGQTPPPLRDMRQSKKGTFSPVSPAPLPNIYGASMAKQSATAGAQAQLAGQAAKNNRLQNAGVAMANTTWGDVSGSPGYQTALTQNQAAVPATTPPTEITQQQFQTPWEQSIYQPMAMAEHQTANRDIDVMRDAMLREAREQGAQAGFQPGTMPYTRLIDRAQAGANIGALEVRNAASQAARDHMLRQAGMDRSDYEYARNRAAALEDWERNAALRKEERAEGLQTEDERQLFTDFQDNPAVYSYLVQSRAQGRDLNDALQDVFDPATNQLRPEFQPQSPFALEIDNLAQSFQAVGDDPATARQKAIEYFKAQQQTVLQPTRSSAQQIQQTEAIRNVINSPAFRTGDYSQMTQNDWTQLRTSPELSAQAGVLPTVDPGLGRSDYESGRAVIQAATASGLNKGALVTHKGQVWLIEDVSSKNRKTIYGDEFTDLSVKARPLEKTGPSQTIYKKEFDI